MHDTGELVLIIITWFQHLSRLVVLSRRDASTSIAEDDATSDIEQLYVTALILDNLLCFSDLRCCDTRHCVDTAAANLVSLLRRFFQTFMRHYGSTRKLSPIFGSWPFFRTVGRSRWVGILTVVRTLFELKKWMCSPT